MRIDRWICVEKRAFMHISFDSSFWEDLLWFVVVMAVAGLIIWLLLFVNKKVFSLLSIKQRGIHLVFFERMNKVIIIVAILILAFSALDSGASVNDALDAMCKAAEEGVEYTKTIIATKGRASYLGERSIGHQDPGATSATYTMQAVRDFIKG